MTYKLLFVCLGNICRSPSAENIMNQLIEEAGLSAKITCDSAGTSGYHIGAAPDRRMNVAAKKRGLELEGKSRKLKPSFTKIRSNFGNGSTELSRYYLFRSRR